MQTAPYAAPPVAPAQPEWMNAPAAPVAPAAPAAPAREGVSGGALAMLIIGWVFVVIGFLLWPAAIVSLILGGVVLLSTRHKVQGGFITGLSVLFGVVWPVIFYAVLGGSF